MTKILRDVPVEKQITRSMRQWEARRAEWQREVTGMRRMPAKGGPYISISREAGSGGIEVAQRLGDTLGWQVYDRQIIEAIASTARVREELVARFDERVLGELDTYVYNVLTGQLLNNTEYLSLLTRVLVSIAQYGNAVILGRGANFILPPETGLRVRLVAPLEARKQYLMRTLGYDEKKALQEIAARDSERQKFFQHHFRCKVETAGAYDVVINTAYISLAGATDAIIKLAETKLSRSLGPCPKAETASTSG